MPYRMQKYSLARFSYRQIIAVEIIFCQEKMVEDYYLCMSNTCNTDAL